MTTLWNITKEPDMSDHDEQPEGPKEPVCAECGQFAHHPLHTGKNSQTGEDEQPIDHAFVAA